MVSSLQTGKQQSGYYQHPSGLQFRIERFFDDSKFCKIRISSLSHGYLTGKQDEWKTITRNLVITAAIISVLLELSQAKFVHLELFETEIYIIHSLSWRKVRSFLCLSLLQGGGRLLWG